MNRFAKDLLVGAVLGAAFLGAALAADGHIPFAGPAKTALYPPDYDVRTFEFAERRAGAAIQAAGREHALTVRARARNLTPAPPAADALADLAVDADGNLLDRRTTGRPD